MSDTEWTSPRKMMDYYLDQSDGIEATQNGSAILTPFAPMREFHKLRTDARFICCVVHCGTQVQK
jgi:hypothetical protein